MPSSHLILCRPLLLLPLIPPSIRVFSSESALHMRWPKWSFSFSISPSNEHPGLTSFRIDWLDLPAVQGTLKSLSTPQFKNINSLALSFFHSPTLTSIESVMPSSHLILCHPLLLLPPIPPSIKVFSNESTLQNGLDPTSPRDSCSPRDSQESSPTPIKSDTVSPSISHGVMGPDAMIFVF